MAGIPGVASARRFRWVLALAIGLGACPDEERAAIPEPHVPTLKADVGVDVSGKVIAIGALNDETGPGATIGRPFAEGKRLLAARIESGVSGLLPLGWTVRLVERDHGYDPDEAVRAYEDIKDEVLFVGTVFGSRCTTPLLPRLARDGLVAFPASLSSTFASELYTPPTAPSYRIEAMRAVDWVGHGRLGIVYQEDDYGLDALAGFEQAATARKLSIVAREVVTPGTGDFAPIVASLRKAGATHVLLATLPSATGPLLRTASTEGYAPVWIGETPAWSDKFFAPEVVPSGVFGTYHQLSVSPYWGEDLPGMKEFEAAWKAYGGGQHDSIVLLSYVQGLVQIEAARRAIAAGDITRAGYLVALRSIDDWDAGGLIQPLSYTGLPYVVGTKARVLRPDFAKSSWKVEAPYAEPTALNAGN